MKIGLYHLIEARYLAATYRTARITPKDRLLYEVEVSEDEISEIFDPDEIKRIQGGSYWVAQVLMRDIVCGNVTLKHCLF
ncbi:hypothetical protein M0R01_02575 [bacterium]|nr:hypothetical protein [bacterium]